MALKDELKELAEIRKDLSGKIGHNFTLFDIFEGNLLEYVLADLKVQLSEKSYETAQSRVPAINVLKRIVDKLSKIYLIPPKREMVGGSEADNRKLSEFTDKIGLNEAGQDANEIFNLAKSVAIEPYLDKGKPCLRVLPPNQFFVVSKDPVNPMRPTHFVKIMGKTKVGAEEREVMFAYTDTEFQIFDSAGEARPELMRKYQNDGKNLFGAIPFVYINRSKYRLIPTQDTDTLSMTKLIPILLTDATFASMFQSFSILYGIDVDDENLTMSPNAFWRFKSKGDDTKPEVGSIKPEADTDKILGLAKTLLALWLESKNIKPGSVGTLTTENAASGIAKMIDESDTSEDRKIQANIFAPAEEELLSLLINKMHPVWKGDKDYIHRSETFGANLDFNSTFPEQKPVLDQTKLLDDELKKLDKGLTTKKRALKKIEPDMTDLEIDQVLTEIDEEKKKEAPKEVPPQNPSPVNPTPPEAA